MIKIDWHTVRASTHTRNTYWRPPREGEQPEASPRWMRQVCRKKKKEPPQSIPSIQPINACVDICVCVCVRSVLVPVTHSNSVSSLKTTQALLAMPPSLPPPQSGVEINIYHIRGKRGRRTNGEAERAKQWEDGDAGGYDDNGFPLGRGQKLMEKWSYLKKQTNKRVERVVQHENSSKEKKKKSLEMNLEVVSGILGDLWSAPLTEFWEEEVCFYVWLSQRCVQCPVPLVCFFASRRGIQNLSRRRA